MIEGATGVFGPGREKTVWLVGLLCAGLLAVYVVVLLLPGTRRFFALAIPNSGSLLLIILGSAIAIGFLWLTDDRFIPLRSESA